MYPSYEELNDSYSLVMLSYSTYEQQYGYNVSV